MVTARTLLFFIVFDKKASKTKLFPPMAGFNTRVTQYLAFSCKD
jgi:hypothetical protein